MQGKVYLIKTGIMKNLKKSLTGVLMIVVLFSGIRVFAQESECKVLLPEISGTYTGQCKNGLANGKGISQGADRYEGQFVKGLPDGKGTYTSSTGSVYKGQWNKGLKDGEGEMTYFLLRGDSVVTGYWKKDKYTGKDFIPPFLVTRKEGVLTSSFRKINEEGNDVIVRFLMGGQINARLSGFTLANSSGSQYKSGPKQGIENIIFPFELKISYTTSNPISRASFDVIFECVINEPGKWEVTINN